MIFDLSFNNIIIYWRDLGLLKYQLHSKVFITRRVSVVKPSSVTNNWEGVQGVSYYLGQWHELPVIEDGLRRAETGLTIKNLLWNWHITTLHPIMMNFYDIDKNKIIS